MTQKRILFRMVRKLERAREAWEKARMTAPAPALDLEAMLIDLRSPQPTEQDPETPEPVKLTSCR